MTKNFFCVMPWIHAQMSQDGTLQPCYQYSGSLTTMKDGLLEAFNGREFSQMRQSMLLGEIPEGCRTCAETESCGEMSLRQQENENHSVKVQQILKDLKPICRSLDLRFSNKCNYRCRICGPEGSTAWSQELTGSDEVLIEAATDKELLWKDLDRMLPTVERISFAGGEPLLQAEQYHLLEKLIEAGRTDVKLFYSTNLSTYTFHQWNILKLWAKFPNLEVALSLDGAGEPGELLRNGMNWVHTISQVELLKEMAPQAKLTIMATFGALNCFHLPAAMETWHQLGWLKTPQDIILKEVAKNSQYELRVLTPAERESLKNHYSSWFTAVEERFDPGLLKALQKFFSQKFLDLESQPCWVEGRKRLRYSILFLDKSRQEKTIKLFPEFLNLLYGKEAEYEL